jgi:hypothetical protein
MFGVGLLIWLKRRRDGWNPQRAKRRRGILRVTAYVVAVSTGFGLFGWHKAHAKMGEASMSFGRDLAPLADMLEESHAIRVNGEKLFLSNTVVKQPMKRVLDRFDGACQEGKPILGQAWQELPKHEQTPQNALYPFRTGVVRSEQKSEGVVMCLTKSDGAPEGLMDALEQFTETGDLGKLGKLRYAYAKQSEDGASTHVMTLWTDSEFSFERIVPADGSEPAGTDPEDAPRPPGGRRLLSARVEGTPFGVYVYRSTEVPAKVVDFYDKEMTDRDWLPVTAPIDGSEGRAYAKEGLEIVLDVGKDEQGTVLSIAEARADRLDPRRTGLNK